jgi:hypothetical protein
MISITPTNSLEDMPPEQFRSAMLERLQVVVAQIGDRGEELNFITVCLSIVQMGEQKSTVQ